MKYILPTKAAAARAENMFLGTHRAPTDKEPILFPMGAVNSKQWGIGGLEYV